MFCTPSYHKCLLLGEEAVALPSIGNTLWRVSVMFTRLAVTQPEVNGFGYCLELAETDFGHDLHRSESRRASQNFVFFFVM